MFPQLYNNVLFDMAKERHAELVKAAELQRVLNDEHSLATTLQAHAVVKSQPGWLTTMIAWLRVRPSATA